MECLKFIYLDYFLVGAANETAVITSFMNNCSQLCKRENLAAIKIFVYFLSLTYVELFLLECYIIWKEEVRSLRTIICSDSSSSLGTLQHSHSESRKDILIDMQQTVSGSDDGPGGGVSMGASTQWSQEK